MTVNLMTLSIRIESQHAECCAGRCDARHSAFERVLYWGFAVHTQYNVTVVVYRFLLLFGTMNLPMLLVKWKGRLTILAKMWLVRVFRKRRGESGNNKERSPIRLDIY